MITAKRVGTVAARLLHCGLLIALAPRVACPYDESTVAPIRSQPLRGLELPFYDPAWGEGRPLELLAQALADDDDVRALDMLTRIIAELDGALMVPPPPPDARQLDVDCRDTLRVPPSHEVLAAWVARLSPIARERLATLSRRLPADAKPVRAGSACLWLPELRAEAIERLELAIENADTEAAWLIASALHPIDDAALGFIARPQTTVATAYSPWTNTFPRPDALSDAPRSLLTARSLRLETKIPVPLATYAADESIFSSQSDDPNKRRDRGFVHKLDALSRETPPNAIYPLLGTNEVLFAAGSEVFAIDTESDYKRLWTVFAGAQGRPKPSEDLIYTPSTPIASSGYQVLLFRTERPEDNLRGCLYAEVVSAPSSDLSIGFNHAYIFRSTTGRQPPTLVAYVKSLPPDSTICAPPLIANERLYLLAVRGLVHQELTLYCLRLTDGGIEWQRRLVNIKREWLASEDAHTLVPEARLAAVLGDIIVITGVGWVARVGADVGDYRGGLVYSRHDERDLPHVESGVNRYKLRKLPRPRLRYPGPDLVLSRDKRSPLFVFLASDARDLIAMDLERFTVEWAHAAEPQCQLLGQVGDELLLLDTTIAADGKEVRLRSVYTNGLLAADPQQIILDSPELNYTAGNRARAPVLMGVPKLIGRELWIPTVRGLEIRALGFDAPTSAPNILPWPTTADGGTPYLLPNGKLLTITRGNRELGKVSCVEIFDVDFRD
ncbi:MAG: hypothetical protein ACKVX7_12380 [Planctomycetota bacterium]